MARQLLRCKELAQAASLATISRGSWLTQGKIARPLTLMAEAVLSSVLAALPARHPPLMAGAILPGSTEIT